MSENIFFRLLEHTLVYQAVQVILAPGGEKYLRKQIKQLINLYPTKYDLLDVGCGPASWLWHEGINPTGLDFSFSYACSFITHGGKMAVGSAERLPFASSTFAGVWSIGLLHHLDDKIAAQAITEMIRVCRPDRYIIIMDAVLPQKTWKRPLASLIRRMDRGQFMRHQSDLNALLPDMSNWSTRRYTYAATGLEMLECIYHKN